MMAELSVASLRSQCACAAGTINRRLSSRLSLRVSSWQSQIIIALATNAGGINNDFDRNLHHARFRMPARAAEGCRIAMGTAARLSC